MFAGVLVEKQLDHKKYRKWNGNDGSVANMNAEQQLAVLMAELDINNNAQSKAVSMRLNSVVKPILAVVVEEDEHDDESEDEIAPQVIMSRFAVQRAVSHDDYPQAFSHFSYWHSNRKHLVCDLQGVLDTSRTPPVFELTDPVVHCKNSSREDQRHLYGRTDHGRKGMTNFFKTHICNNLCAALGLPSDNRNH